MLNRNWNNNDQVHKLNKEKREDCIQKWHHDDKRVKKNYTFQNDQKYTGGIAKKKKKKKRFTRKDVHCCVVYEKEKWRTFDLYETADT